jgi:alkanesulfonate monooxygenase SsuD/methylene tetrahydromethanopterin reductase-like flavin-dependent oxidoreductase (luciferase family)
MRIGLFYPHTPIPHLHSESVAQRLPNVLDINVHRQIVCACETGGFDFVFSYDTTWTAHPRPDGSVSARSIALMSPMLMMALAAMSSRIGLVSTMHVGLLHPVIVARIGANLDALSGGRWALNIVAGAGGAGALISDVAHQGDHDGRYARASEAMQIITHLWTGEAIDFQGDFYRV